MPANECTRVVPMYPSQSAMSHLHSLAQTMYIATFLPKHVNTICFADYVNSTSGAIRLAFDLLPLASSKVFGLPAVICLTCFDHHLSVGSPGTTHPLKSSRNTWRETVMSSCHSTPSTLSTAVRLTGVRLSLGEHWTAGRLKAKRYAGWLRLPSPNGG